MSPTLAELVVWQAFTEEKKISSLDHSVNKYKFSNSNLMKIAFIDYTWFWWISRSCWLYSLSLYWPKYKGRATFHGNLSSCPWFAICNKLWKTKKRIFPKFDCNESKFFSSSLYLKKYFPYSKFDSTSQEPQKFPTSWTLTKFIWNYISFLRRKEIRC